MARTGLTIRILSRRAAAGRLLRLCTVASLLALLAGHAAGEEVSVEKITVEEARLPRLAGTDDWYLLRQLEAFRNGVRGTHADDRTGRQMRAMAAVLPNDQALKDVVAFIQSIQ